MGHLYRPLKYLKMFKGYFVQLEGNKLLLIRMVPPLFFIGGELDSAFLIVDNFSQPKPRPHWIAYSIFAMCLYFEFARWDLRLGSVW